MKLNEFFNKGKATKRPNKKIITVVNEERENLLTSQVADLQQQLGYLQHVNTEKDVLNQRCQSAEIQLKETLSHKERLESEKVLLKDDLKDRDVLKIENQALSNNIKETKGTLSLQEDALNSAQKNNLELNITLQKLTQQVQVLQKEGQSSKTSLDEYSIQAASNKRELSEFQCKFTNLTEIFQTIEVKYKEAQKKNHVLKREHLYWERVAKTLKEENESLEHTRVLLKRLSSDMQDENQVKGSAVRITQKELRKLRDTIQTMTTHMNSLIEENGKLASMSTVMKEELARPKYMSMAAIERNEGFKMPMGGSIKHYLGHGKPTLLKFKNGGSENDN